MTTPLQNKIEEAVKNAVWHKKSALGKDEPVMTFADAMRMAHSIAILAREEALKISEDIFATEVDWSEWGICENEAREDFRMYLSEKSIIYPPL